MENIEKYFESLLNYSNVPIIAWNTQFEIQIFNKAFERVSGYTSDEVIGKNIKFLFCEKKRDAIMKKIELAISGEQWKTIEIPILCKNGSTHVFLWNSANIYDSDNTNIISTIAQGADITELQQKTKEMNIILNSVDEFVFSINGDGVFLNFYSAKKKDDLYLQPEFFINKHYKDVGFPDTFIIQFSFAVDNLKQTKITQSIEYDLEMQGEKHWYNAQLTLQNNNSDNITVVVRDTTKRKNAELQLVQKNKELEISKGEALESSQLKSEFINNMSHEIRTPLNGILGFSNLLNDPNLTNEELKQYVDIIQNSGNQLLQIIEAILEISRLGTKQEKVFVRNIYINDLLSDLFSIFEIKAKEKGLALNLIKGLTDKESSILTDKTKLYTILSNLLENALKFTNEGFIEFGYSIKTDIKPAEIEIYVKDTGIGIKPESQEMIFIRFSQEEKSLSRNVGGLGLGLSIVKESVELLDGKITVQSKKGEGATFFVTIPYKTVNEENLKGRLENDTRKSIKKQDEYTILIVEDEEMNYLYLETLLNFFELNLITLHAKHGKEAVEMCKANTKIDFVLMDMKMPIMNGFDATKIIKKIRPDLPIVAQTAYSTQEEQELAISAGCNDFISKPISKKTLKEITDKFFTANN